MIVLGAVRIVVALATGDVVKLEPALAAALVVAGLAVLRRGMVTG
jgi:hypothetical protein